MDFGQLLDAASKIGAVGVLAYVVWKFLTDQLRTGTMSDRREAVLVAEILEWKGLYFAEVKRGDAAYVRVDRLTEAVEVALKIRPPDP